ncbi:MAG: (2Fe-2S)-binding protein [Gammaproteobacteria bacterium]|jgi:carbon-monoxide dehydrogenase small subunit|nr:(2Fe-2S)-binding protein [Gammaproteobacteria bacterium]MDP6617487.1 (2Fe-2S)-binding protein [Gammaproteobacteria bacterium]MDP6695642.1 (2Fe-2S)-binding protein [Gammaproteobacteria bacterium]
MAKHLVTLTVNGDTYDLVVSDNQTLLDVIRDEVNLKGTKRGCTTGSCGVCCINNAKGEAVLSCLTHALEWDGEEITTIEGLEADGELDAMQKAFIEYGAVQCGFCTPGVIMSARAIVNAHPEPTEEQINAGLAGVNCRCTGQIKVKEAIREDHRFRHKRETGSGTQD